MPFLLFGLSETAALPLYMLVGVYFALPVYAIFGNWTRKSDCEPIRLWLVYTFPAIAFVVLLLCGRPIWFISLWLWGGDLYAESANAVSVLFALVFSRILLSRLATKWVIHAYLRMNLWGIGICLGFLGVIYAIEVAHRIDGLSARGAAEKKFAYLMKPSKFYLGHLPRRIVDETMPFLAAHNDKALDCT